MEKIIFLYIFFNGCVYTAWLWDTKAHFVEKFIITIFGFAMGWLVTPIIIGRVLKWIMNEIN